MPGRVRVVLLCEDRNQERFFRRAIRHLDNRPIVKVAPRGDGSGEQWVRANFAGELRSLRSHGGERVGLLVVMDGDLIGLPRRKAQLDEAARNAGLEPRRRDERIAFCIPTRNLETWVRALCHSGEVNEQDDYKKLVESDDVVQAAKLWVNDPGACGLPSCIDARKELERLED